MAIDFTKDEIFELNDAINEVVGRMLRDGQTPEEIDYHSLRNLWTAWRRITVELHGTANTPAMERQSNLISIAMAHPKNLINTTRS